jgi:PAS domain-containing protein
MGRPLGDACLDIASYARERKHEFLSYILRLAAAEAYKSADEESFDLALPRKFAPADMIVGIWDWDISHDRTYGDASCAELFSIDPQSAARGLPVNAYLDAIHPDDIGHVKQTLADATRLGGVYQVEHRVIKNDRLYWVFARGHCTLDRHGRPVRLPRVLVDITHQKAMH